MQEHHHASSDRTPDNNGELSLSKIMEMSRPERRRHLHYRSAAPHRRVRSGVPTGTTPHFRAWMADLDRKRILHGMKLDHLADTLDGRLASTFALLRVGGRIRNVYQLSQANLADLLSIPQVGPARLAEVEKYLNGKRVELNWTAA